MRPGIKSFLRETRLPASYTCGKTVGASYISWRINSFDVARLGQDF